MQDLFVKQFRDGYSLGAQLNVAYEGNEVLNLHGQYNQPDYDENSLQVVFSSTKVMSPIVIALLVERNLLSYHYVSSISFIFSISRTYCEILA
jgi:hypothetical protein